MWPLCCECGYYHNYNIAATSSDAIRNLEPYARIDLVVGILTCVINDWLFEKLADHFDRVSQM